MSETPFDNTSVQRDICLIRDYIANLPCAVLGDGLSAWEIGYAESVKRSGKLTGPLWRRLVDRFSRFRQVHEDVARVKKKLLRTILLGQAGLVLNYSEDPMEEGIAGDWQKLDSASWLVPRNVDAERLFDWFELGGWTLYCRLGAQHDIRAWKTPSFRDPSAVLKSMVAEEIAFCLDSFYDNDPWHLFLNPNST